MRPNRPDILFYGANTPYASENYQDYLLTIFNYGTKVAGLQTLPLQWVPPFAALPAWVSEEWRNDPKSWWDTVKAAGIDIVAAYNTVSSNGARSVILRSSAVGEGLEDRGRYDSIQLDAGASIRDILNAIENIFLSFSSSERHPLMGVCIQQFFEPEFAGHVSNEVHLSATRNQWKFEIERPSYVPYQGLNSKFAAPPPENDALHISGQKAVAKALRQACHLINMRTDGRSHVEWCVSDSRLWIVQVDRESPISAGANPHEMPLIHGSTKSLNELDAPKFFEPYKIETDQVWKKLSNIRDFWIGPKPPRHRLFFATANRLSKVLKDKPLRRKLIAEINQLTDGRAVLRTDCSNREVRAFNLPRTTTIDGRSAARWLDKTIPEMKKKGAKLTEIAFILHRYIPARAAAWSYYSPGEEIVSIDCIWGLPDGLQFLGHDSFQMNARTGKELSAEVRFKRDFLQEQADGSWIYVPIARQFGRDRVLSSDALRHIALQTVAIARKIGERAQVMWFCDLPPSLGLGTHLPWYRSKDFLIHQRIERPPLPVRRLRSLDDLNAIGDDLGQVILRLEPTVELVRDDHHFLDQVIAIALQHNAPVELAGSVLGHAYYKLRDAGVLVLTPQPKFERSRGKTEYRKLVRDEIPHNIASKGEQVSFARLSKDEANVALVAKLFEEGLELKNTTNYQDRIEELADVLEVLRGFAALEGIDWNQLENVADEKKKKRGGFDQQTVLIQTAMPQQSRSSDLMISEDNPQTMISLREIGLVTKSEGKIVVPFTRLMTASGIDTDIPFENVRLGLKLSFSKDGIVVVVSPPTEFKDAPESQLGLFEGEG